MNTSHHSPDGTNFKVPDDFECIINLPDSACAAINGNFIASETHLNCEHCGAEIQQIIAPEEGNMQLGEEDSDDDEGDYEDEVTVSESELDTYSTPEERAAITAFNGIDHIKNTCRTSKDVDIQQFAEWVNERKFEIRDMYMILHTRDFFPLGMTKERRVMGLILAQALYIEKQIYEIPLKVYDFLNFNQATTRKDADRAFEEYTGDSESRIEMWIRLYGSTLGIPKETIATAIELWNAAEPVYIAVDEKVRAVVWVALTDSKINNKRFNRADISRKTGIGARTLAKVQKKYQPYFE